MLLERCIHRCLLGGCLLSIAFSQCVTAAEALQPHAAREIALTPFLQQYCYDCHQGEDAAAGLSLEKLNSDKPLTAQRRRWLRVLERLRDGDMPPEEAILPTKKERDKLVEWLDAELNSLDCSQPIPPTQPTLRRLNRVEYANTVRDLTGVSFDVETFFPRDELGFGFDNNGDALSLSPLLVEKYLEAAARIAEEAIAAPESIFQPEIKLVDGRLRGGNSMHPGRLLITNSRAWGEFDLPQAGRYLLRVRVYATQAGDELAKMRLEVGDETLRLFEVAAEENDPHTYVVSFDGKAGRQRVAAAFTNDAYYPSGEEGRRDRNLGVLSLSVVGPLPTESIGAETKLPIWTPSDEQWNSEDQWQQPVSKQLRRLLSRAFRRPAHDEEVERYAELVATARERGDSYPRAMQLALQATLVSPQFLFRGELPSQPPSSEAATANEQPAEPARQITDWEVANRESAEPARQITDWQLATRVSYFLTSSMPDEELTRVVAAGKLDAELDKQVNRLLASERSAELIRQFGQQWLETRRMEGMERDERAFPEYDAQLAADMQQETVLFLRDMLRAGRPLTDLLQGKFSFLNARLAKHYGVELPPETAGDAFVRMELPPRRQGGVLTHGSVLTVTSHVDRTSPVLRGKWIMDHLLNDPPPDPPPGVTDLDPPPPGEKPKSLRKQLEQHRADPNCAVCHKQMDQLGFALDHYDAVGRWRDTDNGLPIDDQGQLPKGEPFSGIEGLRKVLLADFARVRRALAANLLTYALGRGLVYYDECALDEIVAATEAGGDTLEAMIKAVIHSAPFQQRY